MSKNWKNDKKESFFIFPFFIFFLHFFRRRLDFLIFIFSSSFQFFPCFSCCWFSTQVKKEQDWLFCDTMSEKLLLLRGWYLNWELTSH